MKAIALASSPNASGAPPSNPVRALETFKLDVLNGRVVSVKVDGLSIVTAGKTWSLSVPMAGNKDQRVLYTEGKETRPLTVDEIHLASGCFIWGASSARDLGEQGQELMVTASTRMNEIAPS